jgi:hypothetical protein
LYVPHDHAFGCGEWHRPPVLVAAKLDFARDDEHMVGQLCPPFDTILHCFFRRPIRVPMRAGYAGSAKMYIVIIIMII